MNDRYQIGSGPLRLFVLGATGGTGRAFVERALEHGHRVTAFVRSPEKVECQNDRLTVLGGDVRDERALATALPGHDAILSAVGPRKRGQSTLIGDTARATLAAMSRASVPRLIVVSAALLYPAAGLLYRVLAYLLRENMRDTAEMERQVSTSDLQWTIVRPPRLLDGKGGRPVRVAETGPPPAMVIDRSDLGPFLLDVVEQDRYLRRVVGVSR
jgi:putative NADH-flavin reductase